jgi:hypothetical protein
MISATTLPYSGMTYPELPVFENEAVCSQQCRKVAFTGAAAYKTQNNGLYGLIVRTKYRTTMHHTAVAMSKPYRFFELT